jgi:hypothetical protein
MLANALFWEIERVTSKLIDQIEYEGQEFMLTYDFSLNVNFNEVNNGDY